MDGPIAILGWIIHVCMFAIASWLIYRAFDPKAVTARERRLTSYGGVVAIATVGLSMMTPLPYLGNPLVVLLFGGVLLVFPQFKHLGGT